MTKRRITVSVERELVAAGAAAVSEGRAESMSGWVSEALADKVRKDRRLAALADAITAYEAEHGVMTEDEMAAQVRADREAAARNRAGVRNAGAV